MKMQHGIVLILLLGLVAGAAAAGDTPPVFPQEFYGGVTIGGSPAPAGTVITATIGETECGSIQTVESGKYGDPDRRLGGRLIVTGTADQVGETITFSVNGVAAPQTSVFTSEAITALDLSVPGSGGSGGGGSGGGSGGSSKDPGSQLTYDPDAEATTPPATTAATATPDVKPTAIAEAQETATQGPATALPTWALALIVVLAVALAASLLMRRK
ncbi:hypothetical protein [Methanoculleus oceani]|uniref:Uncharacterized protein n=1 Tax=Methanoculleus oceani TaxID=2184756 RepID=A0ABD4THQ5_9EURY|nr:hypothetical protein [Methanoculleus sp. CWC-02]MCM2467019.1 hypothetical protein [Methanoculleus sp. CWC-02]